MQTVIKISGYAHAKQGLITKLRFILLDAMTELTKGAAFVSNSFSLQFLPFYKLVISVAEYGIAYALVNESNEVFLFKQIENKASMPFAEFEQSAFTEEALFQHKFKSIEIISHTNNWILIPAEFLHQSNMQDYIRLLFQKNPDDFVILQDGMDTFKMLNLYLMYPNAHNLYTQIFQNPGFSHIVTRTIQLHATFHPRFQLPYSAHIELFEDKFIYTIFKDQQLFFCNVYTIYGPNDVMYYTLSINKTLSIPSEKSAFFLTGSATFIRSVESEIRKYFRNMKPADELFFKQPSLNHAGIHHHSFPYLLFSC